MPWNLIPQIFYDLLARVVPGAMLLLLALAVAINLSSGLVEAAITRIAAASVTLSLISALVLSYGLGFMADHLFASFESLRIVCELAKKRHKRGWEESVADFNKTQTVPYEKKFRDIPSVNSIVQQIEGRFKVEDQRLTKLHAEIVLSRTFGFIFLLAAILNGFLVGHYNQPWITSRILFELALILFGCASLIAWYFLQGYLASATYLAWLRLGLARQHEQAQLGVRVP